MRWCRRRAAAKRIQAVWRGYQVRGGVATSAKGNARRRSAAVEDKAAADRVSALRPAGLDLEANAAWKETRGWILLEAGEVKRNQAPRAPRLWEWRGGDTELAEQTPAQDWGDGERWRDRGKGDTRRRCEAVGDKAEAARVGALRLAGLDSPNAAKRPAQKC